MKLKYQNKEITLIECKNFYTRFKGFMLQKNINHALLFRKCNSIHTFFMKEPIDVIFTNEDNIIISYYKNLTPNKIIWPQKLATRVYETPANYFDINNNDKLEVIEWI